jgi:hypothetical protein
MKVKFLLYAFILSFYFITLKTSNLQYRYEEMNNLYINKTLPLPLISKEDNILRNEFLNYIKNFSEIKKKNKNKIIDINKNYITKIDSNKNKNQINDKFLYNDNLEAKNMFIDFFKLISKNKNNLNNNIDKNKNNSSLNKIKNLSTFIETHSEIATMKKINNNNVIINTSEDNSKENKDKKSNLSKLKNLLEKFVKKKEKKENLIEKDVWTINPREKSFKKNEFEIKEAPLSKKISKKKLKKFRERIALTLKDKEIKCLEKIKKEKLEELKQKERKEIEKLKKNKKIEFSKKKFVNLQKNPHNYNSDLTHISMKHSPKNLIINSPDFILDNPEITMLPKETIQSNNQIYKHQNFSDSDSFNDNKNASKDNKKVYIPIEDCNKEWDYKVHGDDWQCLVFIYLINLNYFNIFYILLLIIII